MDSFGVVSRDIEKICIEVACETHVLVVGREVRQSVKEFY